MSLYRSNSLLAVSAMSLSLSGGSALLALELVERTTKDVDVVALRQAGLLSNADPPPPDLIDARNRVASDFGLSEDWLNPGPASLMDFGLPEGFCGASARGTWVPV